MVSGIAGAFINNMVCDEHAGERYLAARNEACKYPGKGRKMDHRGLAY